MRRAAGIALLVAGVLSGVCVAAPHPGAEDRGRLDRIVRFLQDTQNDDGGYGGAPGADSDPLISAWVGIGLAAAGINPQDQKAPGGGASVAQYLAGAGAIGNDPVTTEFERITMFVNAAGLDPRAFGGRNYIVPLLQRQSTVAWEPAPEDIVVPEPPDGAGGLSSAGTPSEPAVAPAVVPPGWFPHARGGTTPGVNDTIFALFALVGTGGDDVAEPIRRAAGAVVAMQRPDGTWPSHRPGDRTSVDMTGAAVQALCAARRCATKAVRRALAWLKVHQQADGGWQAGDLRDELPGESNSGTTPWVVQALWAAGIDPVTWRRGGRDPLDFLATLQRRDGSIQWRQSRDLNPTWMTAYSAPAYAGQAWPVTAPPRAATVRAAARAAGRRATERRKLSDALRRGDAGEVAGGRGVVTAGGGGNGAQLFSRPAPQSRGVTPGGERDLTTDQEPLTGTRGRNGATGTAAASGPGDDGGVQNGRRTPGGSRPALAAVVSGQVVRDPRGTEGDQLVRAIAPGLSAADSGGTTPPWGALAFALLSAFAFSAGLRLERDDEARLL